MKNEIKILLLGIAMVFRVAFLFKPQVGNQTDVAVNMAEEMVFALERKHGKIDFDA